MFDYRLFFPSTTLENRIAARRRVGLAPSSQERVYRLTNERRPARESARR